MMSLGSRRITPFSGPIPFASEYVTLSVPTFGCAAVASLPNTTIMIKQTVLIMTGISELLAAVTLYNRDGGERIAFGRS